MTDVRPDLCPACGYFVEAATGLNGEGTPGPGDLSICLNCAALNVWDSQMQLVPAPLGTTIGEAGEAARQWILRRGPLDKKPVARA